MQLEDFFEQQKNSSNKTLKNIFGNRIKQNFLIEIKERIQKEMSLEVFQYFDVSVKMDSLVTGYLDNAIEFDICRMIVGCHRSNTIFLNDSERSSLQQSEDYKEKLIEQVTEEIRLRLYAAHYFRKIQLVKGEEFLFYPILYKLYALSLRALEIIDGCKSFKRKDYINIFNKALASMTMIENNFMDSAYPLLRGVIEVFIKSFFFTDEHKREEINRFLNWELLKTANTDYPEEFLEQYENRKDKKQKSKIDYLHYGWVDRIPGYHESINSVKPYSIYGLFEFLKLYAEEDKKSNLNLLQSIYSRCHAFTHGSIGNSGYPLLHYFELSIGLCIPLVATFGTLCECRSIEPKINNIDILKSINDDFEELLKQYSMRSTENFENYYKKQAF